MRRLLVIAVAAVTLLIAAGCSDKPGTRAAAPGSSEGFGAGTATPDAGASISPGTAGPAASGAPGDTGTDKSSGTLAANTAQVCAAARKASTDAVTTYIAQLAKMLQAEANNDSQGTEAAKKAATAALAKWRETLTTQAAKATDRQLKGVLSDIATEVGRLTVDVEHIDDAKFDQLSEKLTSICGG
jgi:hypothetical protein